jgi:hypothetical protein
MTCVLAQAERITDKTQNYLTAIRRTLRGAVRLLLRRGASICPGDLKENAAVREYFVISLR